MSDTNDKEELSSHQIEDIFFEHDEPLTDVLKSSLRKLVYAAIAFLLVLILLGFIITIPTYINMEFVLKEKEHNFIYRFPETIYVDKVHVNTSAIVKKGDPLIGISSPKIVELITLYNNAIEHLKIYESDELPMYNNEQRTLGLKSEKLNFQLTQAESNLSSGKKIQESELEKLSMESTLANKNYEVNKKLFADGYIAELEWKDYEKKKLNAGNTLNSTKEIYSNELKDLSNNVNQLHLENEILKSEAEKIQQEIISRKKILENEIESIHTKIIQSFGDCIITGGSLTLLTPCAGLVAFVFDADKEVSAGTILTRIAKDTTSNIYGFSEASSSNIGYLKEGQKAVLKVYTFPHYDWGTLQGKVKYLSSMPDAKGLYPFEVEITDSGKLKNFLQVGMSGEVSVLMEEKSFFAYLFDRVQKIYYNIFE